MLLQGKKKNEAGIAVMLALVTITVLSVLAAELIYETQIYKRIIFNSVDRLQSYHLAKTGLKLARLQLLAAKKAKAGLKKLGSAAPVSMAEVEMIWRLPLTLPPPIFPDASLALRTKLESLKKELDLGNATININISGESGKIPLNSLIWKPSIPRRRRPPPNPPVPPPNPDKNENPMSNTVIEILTELISQKKDTDEDFYDQYEYLDPTVLVENLTAWMNINIKTDGDNIPKESYYEEQDPPYHVKNAPLYSFSELRMVKGFEDKLISFLEEYFTATLSEGININTIEEKLFKSLFPSLEEEDVEAFITRREATTFTDIKDFWKFMKEEFEYTDEDKEELEKKGILFTVDETSYRALVEIETNYAKRTWLAYFGLGLPSYSRGKVISAKANDKTPPSIVYLRAD